MAGRREVVPGGDVTLRVLFLDDFGAPIDTDALPNVYIYDDSVSTEVIDEDIAAGVFTHAYAGPFVPTRISTGYYEYVYTVPAGINDGTWYDVWNASVGGIDSTGYETFTVGAGGLLSVQTFGPNEMVLITLDDSIANLSGTATLGTDVVLSFMTQLSPMYASPTLLRLETGSILDTVPDDTLALLIRWSSKEADFISIPQHSTTKRWHFARTKFVVCDAILRLFQMPGLTNGLNSGSYNGAPRRKQLGDLLVDMRNLATVATLSSGIDMQTVDYFRRCRQEWWRVVNAGATINPGQGLGPITGITGLYDPDYDFESRMWADPKEYPYGKPTINDRGPVRGHRHTYLLHKKRRR